MLRLTFILTPPHPTEEAQFLEDVQDKTSPLFHQFLSAEDWNTRFGPSVQDEQTVADSAASQGFTVTYRFPNRLMIDVEAPVGVIQNALRVNINRYQTYDKLGLPGDIEYSNDREPVLPSEIASIVQVVQGLNSFARMHPVTSLGGHVTRHPDYISGPATRSTISLSPNPRGRAAPARIPAPPIMAAAPAASAPLPPSMARQFPATNPAWASPGAPCPISPSTPTPARTSMSMEGGTDSAAPASLPP